MTIPSRPIHRIVSIVSSYLRYMIRTHVRTVSMMPKTVVVSVSLAAKW